MSTGQENFDSPEKKKLKSEKHQPAPGHPSGEMLRLQRVMAAAGIGSRRECELIILEGRVEVDGQIVATLGVKVDPDQQKIFVDGERLTPERLEYFALNKPPGIVSTSRDPDGRARVIDLIKTQQRVYNVGRLDQSSEGLILITNDGELANQLTHPKFGIEKKYHVQVDGVPEAHQLRSLEEGIYIAEGKAKATSAKLLKKTGATSWLEIVLSEGRNREIRRLLAKIGHKVRTLRRVAIGPLKMGELPLGAHRRLTQQEVKMLKRSAAGFPVSSKGEPDRRSRTPTKNNRNAASAEGSSRSPRSPQSKPQARSSHQSSNRSPSRSSSQSPSRSSSQSPSRSSNQSPSRSSSQSPSRSPSRSPSSSPRRSSNQSPSRSSNQSPSRSSSQSPSRSSNQSPSRSPSRSSSQSPSRSPNKSAVRASDQSETKSRTKFPPKSQRESDLGQREAKSDRRAIGGRSSKSQRSLQEGKGDSPKTSSGMKGSHRKRTARDVGENVDRPARPSSSRRGETPAKKRFEKSKAPRQVSDLMGTKKKNDGSPRPARKGKSPQKPVRLKRRINPKGRSR